MDNYDEKFLNRFMELLEEVKDSKETMVMSVGFLQRVRFLATKQKYRNILDEKMNDLGISNLVIKLDARDTMNLDLEMNYDIFTKNVIIKPALIQDNTLPNKNKEENNMLKILEIYKEKKTKEIEQKYDKQLEDIEENDPISVYLKQTEEAIKEMLNSENVKLIINSDVFEFTKETIDKKNEIINTIRTEKAKIKAQIEEIEALLELAPNYEEKLQILRDYGIIDKRKNIIL